MDFHACRRGATPGNDDAVRCRLAARLDPEEKRKPVALPRAAAGVPDVLEIRLEAEVGRENRQEGPFGHLFISGAGLDGSAVRAWATKCD
jgi:hypothetical protein